jgi:HD-GYP domain-containing protein (c-di-GMP phosphodiesterase class II)
MYNKYIGRTAKHDIFTKHGILIISANGILNHNHISILQKHQIPLGEMDVIPLSNEKLISRAATEIFDIFTRIKAGEQIPVQDIENEVLPSVSAVTENPDLQQILAGLQSKDDYTYRHNIGVAVFSNMIGKWTNLSERDLSELTVAATLHDIGKIHIPIEILNKPGRFNDEEFQQMKQHALLGYQILQNAKELSDRAKLVALQHHERFDGSGYPYGITGDQMEHFSKIVAVADIFHALSTNRVYRQSMPFYKIIDIMQEEAFGKLDNSITMLFIRRIMEMAVGSQVRLTDGRTGKVVMINNMAVAHPLIELADGYLDLSKNKDVRIESLVNKGLT